MLYEATTTDTKTETEQFFHIQPQLQLQIQHFYRLQIQITDCCRFFLFFFLQFKIAFYTAHRYYHRLNFIWPNTISFWRHTNEYVCVYVVFSLFFSFLLTDMYNGLCWHTGTSSNQHTQMNNVYVYVYGTRCLTFVTKHDTTRNGTSYRDSFDSVTFSA